MRIEDITKKGLIDATDLELKRLLYQFAKFWDRHFKNNNNAIVGIFKRQDFIAKYSLLRKEIESDKRSLQHSTCDLDRQVFKQRMQAKSDGIDLSPFAELITAQNCVILDENFATADKINFTIQATDSDSFSEMLEAELVEIVKDQFDKVCVFTYDSDYEGIGIPIFHQILRPVSKIEKVDIKKGKTDDQKTVEKGIEIVPVEKADEQIVYGIVYEPDTKDAQGDQASAEEIQKAAYDFMENAQAFKVMHKGKKVKIQILENYIAPCDFEIEKRKVKKGSWVLVTRVLDNKLWKEIKAGKLTGYSMAGYAKVE